MIYDKQITKYKYILYYRTHDLSFSNHIFMAQNSWRSVNRNNNAVREHLTFRLVRSDENLFPTIRF